MALPSGKFVVRLTPQLHNELIKAAQGKGVSLNRLCCSVLSQYRNFGPESEIDGLLLPITKLVLNKFGDDLSAIILFGSYASGKETSASDIDLLIVLKNNVPITRVLYSWWDDNIKQPKDVVINPHFVAKPTDLTKVTGLWFEVAQNHKLIFQRKNETTKLLDQLNDLITDGVVRRHISNGHYYWEWRKDEER